MVKYIKREMPDIHKKNESKAYYKMKCAGQLNSDDLIERMCYPGSGISRPMAKAVLAQLSSISSEFLAMGYNVSIEGIGQFTAKVGPKEDFEVEGLDDGSTKRKATSLEVTGVNFRVDKDFVKEINSRCVLKRGTTKRLKKSPYTPEKRLQKLQKYLVANKTITLREYAYMVGMTRSSAYRELEKLVADPSSGISTSGQKNFKVYILANQ